MEKGKNLKVALCLSGHLRTIKICLPTWSQFLLSNKNIEFDVFVHTWSRLDHHYKAPIDLAMSSLKQLNIKKIKIEEPINFNISDLVRSRSGGYIPEHTLSQFYSLQKVFELKRSFENEKRFKYDCAIRFRPDIYLREQIPIHNSLDLSKLHLPKYGDFSGINDQMCFSNSDSMDYYSKIFSNIESYLKEDNNLTMCTEIFVKLHCQKANFQFERHPILYNICRRQNSFLPDNRTRELDMGFKVD